MEKRDRFSPENNENFSFFFIHGIDRIQLNTFDTADDANQNKKESIFCHKTIINFRFDFIFLPFSFIFPFCSHAFTLSSLSSSSFLDGMKNHEHATNAHTIYIKTAIPSNIVVEAVVSMYKSNCCIFRSDHPFGISYHISELFSYISVIRIRHAQHRTIVYNTTFNKQWQSADV